VISLEDARRLAHALADEIGTTAEPGTAGLIEELVRRPGAQSHRSILLGHESGWLDLVWRACEIAEVASEPNGVDSDHSGS
jgi:hypothetical protein